MSTPLPLWINVGTPFKSWKQHSSRPEHKHSPQSKFDCHLTIYESAVGVKDKVLPAGGASAPPIIEIQAEARRRSRTRVARRVSGRRSWTASAAKATWSVSWSECSTFRFVGSI